MDAIFIHNTTPHGNKFFTSEWCKKTSTNHQQSLSCKDEYLYQQGYCLLCSGGLQYPFDLIFPGKSNVLSSHEGPKLATAFTGDGKAKGPPASAAINAMKK